VGTASLADSRKCYMTGAPLPPLHCSCMMSEASTPLPFSALLSVRMSSRSLPGWRLHGSASGLAGHILLAQGFIRRDVRSWGERTLQLRNAAGGRILGLGIGPSHFVAGLSCCDANCCLPRRGSSLARGSCCHASFKVFIALPH
jgi:hypothetical protein